MGGRVHRHGLHAGRGHLADDLKVLLPLALPSVFNSMRLIFGLAFGYIMLAELVKVRWRDRGAGRPDQHLAAPRSAGARAVDLVDHSDGRAGHRPAFFLVQAELFPYRYGGSGHTCTGLIRAVLHGWEDLRWLFSNARFTRSLRTPVRHPRTSADPEAP